MSKKVRTARQRRRAKQLLAVAVCLGIGLLTALGCLTVNWVAGSPVQWFWLLVAPLYVSGIIGAFLAIRFAREA